MRAADSASSARRRWFILILLVLVVLAVLAGIALSRLHAAAAPGPGATPTAKTELGAGSAPASAPASEPASAVSTRTAPVREPTSAAPATTAAATGPVITRFHVTAKPSCPSGTDKFRTKGQPVTLEWKVTGADKTTLSVDGPGIYKEYGPAGSETLNFPCSGDPGSYQTHTYTLTAVGPSGTKSKKIVV